MCDLDIKSHGAGLIRCFVDSYLKEPARYEFFTRISGQVSFAQLVGIITEEEADAYYQVIKDHYISSGCL